MGYRAPGGADLRCLCAPWWLLGDTASPSAELVAAGLSAEVGGGEEAVAAPTGRGARSERCAAARSGCFAAAAAAAGTGLGPREGGRGQGTGPRAAERLAVPEKDELGPAIPWQKLAIHRSSWNCKMVA